MSEARTKEQRCEQIVRGGRLCRNRGTQRANGLNVCPVHKRRIDKTFADADKRWKAAGYPESDL